MVKVKWLAGGAGIGYAYFENDICEMPELQAQELIERGYLERVKTEKPVYTPDLPEDIPGRLKLINAKIATISELKTITDLTEIEGIGKTLAVQIKSYLNKL
jgi:hypothetical protein